jgi:hypothetical protein
MNLSFSIIVDVALIVFLGVGIFYAIRLMAQLATFRSSRADMERFVMEFNGTVLRADASIKGLKQAARSSGDDLEQLIEKAQKMTDELNIMIETADQIASRLGDGAAKLTATLKTEPVPARQAPPEKPVAAPIPQQTAIKTSAAEKDLLNALEKMG